MLLRDALIQQNPTLALQRAAMDEIAKLDCKLEKALVALYSKDIELAITTLEKGL